MASDSSMRWTDDDDRLRARDELRNSIRSRRTLRAVIELLTVHRCAPTLGAHDGEILVLLPLEGGFQTEGEARRALATWTHVTDMLTELLDCDDEHDDH